MEIPAAWKSRTERKRGLFCSGYVVFDVISGAAMALRLKVDEVLKERSARTLFPCFIGSLGVSESSNP